MQKYMDEETRRDNLVIADLLEQKGDGITQKAKEEKVHEYCQNLTVHPDATESTFQEGRQPDKRELQICFKDRRLKEQRRRSFLLNGTNLLYGDDLYRVTPFAKPDLTGGAQMDADRKLRDELRTRRDNGQSTRSQAMIQLPSAMPSVKEYMRVARRILDRNVAPYIAILLLSSTTAGLFYILEQTQPRLYDKRVQEDHKCIGNYTSFAPSVFFVLSLCSTIGFGTLYPCTTATRILTVPVLLIGITLFLYVVADIGERTDGVFRRMYNAYRRELRYWQRKRALSSKLHYGKLFSSAGITTRCQNGPTNGPVEDPLSLNLYKINDIPFIDEDDRTFRTLTSSGHQSSLLRDAEFSDLTSNESETEEDLPVWIGALLTMACVAISALYYAFAEDYSPSQAVYFSFLAFFAGDFIAYNFSYALPMFLFIFAGFSMISMTINTALANFKNLINRVKTRAKQQIEAAQIDENGNLVVTDPSQIISELMQEFGAEWVLSFIPTKELVSLHEYCEETKERVQEVKVVERRIEEMKQEHEKVVRSLQESPKILEKTKSTSTTNLPTKPKTTTKKSSYAQTTECSDAPQDSPKISYSVVGTNCCAGTAASTQTNVEAVGAVTQTMTLAIAAFSQANIPPPPVPSEDCGGQTSPLSTLDKCEQQSPREEFAKCTQTANLGRTVGTQFPGKFPKKK